jgi:hypothetical protein
MLCKNRLYVHKHTLLVYTVNQKILLKHCIEFETQDASDIRRFEITLKSLGTVTYSNDQKDDLL